MDEIGQVARQWASDNSAYAPVYNGAMRLALMVEQGDVEFCCADAEEADVAWFSWYPWKLVCEIHAMASGLPAATTSAGVVCDGCGAKITSDGETVTARLDERVVIRVAICQSCPPPPS